MKLRTSDQEKTKRKTGELNTATPFYRRSLPHSRYGKFRVPKPNQLLNPTSSGACFQVLDGRWGWGPYIGGTPLSMATLQY